jgi:uncharacterized protein YuzE
MIKKFKFDYDYENDSLFVYDPKTKSKASVELDDLIIDYNTNKEVSAIELLNASDFFKNITAGNVLLSKDNLKDIIDCSIDIIPKNNFFLIKFIFTLKSKEKITAPILVPTICEPSPAIIA